MAGIIHIRDLERRVQRLEEIERTRGDLFLYLVLSSDTEYIVVSPSIHEVQVRIPLQETITFIGMASPQYTQFTIIKAYAN